MPRVQKQHSSSRSKPRKARSTDVVASPEFPPSQATAAAAPNGTPLPLLEVRKAPEAIFIRPERGEITAVMHKVFNILVAKAAMQNPKGTVFSLAISELVRDSEFNSNNRMVLQTAIRRLVQFSVEWNIIGERNSQSEWGVAPLVAGAKILGGRTLQYSFSPQIQDRLLDPAVYQRINLRVLAQFRSRAAMALYEACLRYATNPSQLTAKLPWQTWRDLLVSAKGRITMKEFKYFNRDILKPALAEIESVVDDFEITPLIGREGRWVSTLQFRVHLKRQPSLALEAPVDHLIDPELVRAMGELGIPEEQAAAWLAEYDEDVVKRVIALVKQRVSSRSLPPVQNVTAFTRTALAQRYDLQALPEAKATGRAEPAHSGLSRSDLLAKYRSHQAAEAMSLFAEMPESERSDRLKAFAATLSSSLAQLYAKWGLESKVVATAFYTWLAERLWGAPTTEQLLEFLLTRMPEAERVGG